MQMTTELLAGIRSLSDADLLDELTRPDGDLEYKVHVNAIALERILSRLVAAGVGE